MLYYLPIGKITIKGESELLRAAFTRRLKGATQLGY
jgi:hypothetical protein